jgi:hypothetical protein
MQEKTQQLPPAHEDGNEVEPNGPEMWFTVPQDDADIEKMKLVADKVIAGQERLYIFMAFEYPDKSLPPNKLRLTEQCRWVKDNFEAWHLCGSNRTITIDARR